VEIRADPVYLEGMKGLDLKSFYAQSLGISAPWKVTDVAFDGDQSLVRITVECAAGVVWADPETGERAEIKGWRERTWRHLDTCHFQTIVTARIPRLLLRDGKTMSVSVPWAEPGGRLTRALEEHVIDLLRECRTVRAAARFAVLTDDVVDGVMRRAVTRELAIK
jgi:transposase